MELTAAATGPDAMLDEAARQEWLASCEAAYATVYRGLIAMGAAPDDAADALQDAFEVALRQRAPVGRPDGWLFVVAKRRWSRSRWRRRIFRPLEVVRGSFRSDREDEIDLLRELDRLTERQRTVIVARYVLGLTQREIGSPRRCRHRSRFRGPPGRVFAALARSREASPRSSSPRA
jgi:DNA-directed RNA polymerase specialized sigma24 family protein